MTFPKKIEHVLVGTVVAFDADTGEVLDVVEKFVETEDEAHSYAKPQITSIECEEIRADAARSFPQRRVDVIVGAPEMDHSDEGASVRYHVDPKGKTLRMEPERDLILEARRTGVFGPRVSTPKVAKKKKKEKKKKSR
jgi:hypothetical protein